jgi:hypothetical protein
VDWSGSDTNEERDFVVEFLNRVGLVYKPGESVSIGRVNCYLTDGFVAVADLGGA